MVVMLEDLNVKVANNNRSRDEVMERHGVGVTNDSEERLTISAVRMDYLSPGRYSHMRTSDWGIVNQIDHVMVNGNTGYEGNGRGRHIQ